MKTSYHNGNILDADADIIVNVVNCMGKYDTDLCLQIKEKWDAPCEEYQRVCDQGYDYPFSILGTSQVVGVSAGKYVANCFAQLTSSTPYDDNTRDALKECLWHVRSFASVANMKIAIHGIIKFGESKHSIHDIVDEVFNGYMGEIEIYI